MLSAPIDQHHLGGVGVFSLCEDSEGHLWAGEAESGLWRWKPGPPQRVLPEPVNTSQAITQGDRGTGLIAVSGGSSADRSAATDTEEYAIPGVRQPFARSLLRDRNGGLWIGTWQQGLLHVYDGKTTRFAHADGLSSDAVTALFEDREGSIWVGTTNGIDRFREPAGFHDLCRVKDCPAGHGRSSQPVTAACGSVLTMA